MGEDVGLGPAFEIELRAGFQEGETGGGQRCPPLAFKHGVERLFEAMQVKHVRSGIFELLR